MSLVVKKNGKTMLGDEVYAAGKKIVQVVIPAISTMYFALSGIWGLPAPEKVIGTLAAVATFLGVSLHISSSQYDSSGAAYDGTIHTVNTDEGTQVHFNVDPQDLVSKDSVAFKVVPPPTVPLPQPNPFPTPTPPAS